MSVPRANKTRPVGRPTVATDENLAKAQKYVAGAYLEDEVIPTVEGCADYLDISTETMYARPEFSDIVKAIKRKQAKKILSKGLTGEYNPMIGKLILASKHGYVEKTATEADNRNVNLDATELTDDELDAKLAKLKSV